MSLFYLFGFHTAEPHGYQIENTINEKHLLTKYVDDKIIIEILAINNEDKKFKIKYKLISSNWPVEKLYFFINRPKINNNHYCCIVNLENINLQPNSSMESECDSFLMGEVPIGDGLLIDLDKKASSFGLSKDEVISIKLKQDTEKIKLEKEKIDSEKQYNDEINKFPQNIRSAIKKHQIILGMTPRQVVLSWGSPENKNITFNKFGKSEQWVYGLGEYVYFENGKVTSLQVSR